ncbi:type I-B CRISPR-associated protein Cas8b/Csh1 [Anaerovorax odorimutans]|uniref:Type I-B CRISPR-associated protein Cas8b/Csh1 n=1 Tax=Anaerovorax odorimutans TaxID=109327 RepID=A0ABT1RLB8_9FIRM|nr:type I-B CRISPR-associated protein Cas8b/Csh1 [Anaerovorax odorimutans]MCQ4635974.1 type I-B CRISPR-associated protein Cas8b/Csh1 [Anaerovorax odorimutans]
MLKDCIEIFRENFKQEGEAYILDNYVPKDGTYIIVRKTADGFRAEEPFDIRYDKKSKTLMGRDHSQFREVCFFDYYSKLIEMNKPMDSGKIIHSNNYLSFAVKKESVKAGKLKEEIIEGYFQTLEDPTQKYKKAKSRALYMEVEQDLGTVDTQLLNEIKGWIIEHIFSLDIDWEKKDYLKLYFALEDPIRTKELYKQESKRYNTVNIYNNNDFNLEIDETTFGLPNDNMGMNSKKPYLANRKRGPIELPYLLNREEVLMQAQFFDYLMCMVSVGKYDIYFDTTKQTIKGLRPGESLDRATTGYYMRLRKEKNEVAILDFQTVAYHSPNLERPFSYKAFLKVDEKDEDCRINQRNDLEALIDEILFNNCLRSNYFTDPGDLMIKDGVLSNNLLMARERLHSWLYTKDGTDVAALLDRVSEEMIYHSITEGFFKKAKKQLNLRWSLHDYFTEKDEMEGTMEKLENVIKELVRKKAGEWDFTSDEEYYFAVGQLVSYFMAKSKAAKKSRSFIHPFINMNNDRQIKQELIRLLEKYGYNMLIGEIYASRLFSRVVRYEPISPDINRILIAAGFMEDNVLFEKQDKEKKNEAKTEGGK